MAEHPGQQLPVAAGPAVLALGGDVVARRELLDHLDVGRQAGPRENAFEQVVAEHGVGRNATGERCLEGVDVVDALAGVRALPEQVLVDVRRGSGIRVDAAGRRKKLLVERTVAANRQRRRHPGLQDAIAPHHPLQGLAEARPVQGVRHLADEAQRRVARQPGIRIQRDHVAHPGRHLRLARRAGHESRVRRPAQQSVELVQLAAFAFPAQPLALAGVEYAAPVQQEESRLAGGPRPVALVQLRDAIGGSSQQSRVACQDLLVGIKPVREQGEGQVAAGAGKVVHFQPFDVLQQFGTAGQQRWHGHQRAQVGRDAVAQRQGGQCDRAEAPGRHAVDQRRRRLGGGKERGQSQCSEQRERTGIRAGSPNGLQRESQQSRRHQKGRSDITADADDHVEAADRQPHRRREADGALEGPPPVGDQVIAGVARALGLRRVRWIGCHRAASLECAGGNVQFGKRRPARQLLDRAAVQVAGGEIHRREGAARAQALVDQAHALEQLGPVDVGDQPHAGDHVANRHVGSALPLLGVLHHLVHGRAL